MNHETYIRRCLHLAQQGRGTVGNGALVGSVLVRDGNILAEAFHSAYGKSHAERELLQKFDQKISSSLDSARDDITLYVNLEPCCHQGKTPPCTDIIIEKGIKTVVFGMQDPDPRVAGQGVQKLKDAGVTVIGPILPALCRRVNRGFISVREHNRPWITLKRAQTRDGIVSQEDQRLMITSDDQNAWAHARLRATHDAILVGVGTVIADDPLLSVRTKDLNKEFVQPWKIILDPQGRIPSSARMLDQRTIIVISDNLETLNSKLETSGARILSLPMKENIFDLSALFTSLITPNGDFHGITSVLIEGGPITWQHFHKAGVIDEEVTLVGSQ